MIIFLNKSFEFNKISTQHKMKLVFFLFLVPLYLSLATINCLSCSIRPPPPRQPPPPKNSNKTESQKGQ